MKIRYGTRGSALALAQSEWVAARLKEAHPFLDIERVVIQTSGDRFALKSGEPVVPLGEGAAIPIKESQATGSAREPQQRPAQATERRGNAAPENVKAMFVQEIEDALLSGSIDFAVHSAKDLPGDIPEGLEIGAYPPREDPRDVYIGGLKAPRWEGIGVGAVIGTSSLRRQIQLRLINPGITFVAMRGNVDTRLRKLEQGQASGLVLAKAGLKRLGRDGVEHQILPVESVVPAPGQGALALEARSDREDVLELLASLDDPKTRIEVECERLFLKAMGGGCSMPLGALAEVAGPASKAAPGSERSSSELASEASDSAAVGFGRAIPSVKLLVFWSDPEGKNPIRRSGSCSAEPRRMAAFVEEMAGQIRRNSAS